MSQRTFCHFHLSHRHYLYLYKQKNTFVFFTSSNSDVGSYKINSLVKKFVKNYKNSKYISNLGDQLYFSILILYYALLKLYDFYFLIF